MHTPADERPHAGGEGGRAALRSSHLHQHGAAFLEQLMSDAEPCSPVAEPLSHARESGEDT
jgi:hypothetical protein